MINKPKLVVDTNVFIDGLISGKVSSQEIMQLFYDINITLLFSQDTIGELAYVGKIMSRKAIRELDKRMEFLNLIMYIFYHSKSVNTIDPKERLEVRCKDPRDDMFLDCAYHGKADYLITDDLKSGLHGLLIDGMTILTSEDFMKLYKEDRGDSE